MIKSVKNMNRFTKIVLLLFLFSFFLVGNIKAQGFNARYKYWSIGGTLNTMNYVGEMDPGPSFLSPGIKFTRYNFGAVVMRRLGSRISARGSFSYGRIGGDDFVNSSYSYKGGPHADINRKSRNLSFFNSIFELKGDVVIDFVEHRGKYQKRPDFVPYMFVGLAYFHHNPKARVDMGGGEKVYNLRDYHTEGQGTGISGASKPYSLNQIALPIGLGMRYKLSTQLDLAFEIGWRFTTTDYLDDAGGKYVDMKELYAATGSMESVQLSNKSTLLDNSTGNFDGLGTHTTVVGGKTLTSYGDAVTGGPRGDVKGRRDAYIITGFHLLYIIPSKVICPKFR
jgi:hypothetical protein